MGYELSQQSLETDLKGFHKTELHKIGSELKDLRQDLKELVAHLFTIEGKLNDIKASVG